MSVELHEALKQHDPERLAALLARGADPNAAQPSDPRWYPLHAGWHPLHAAIEELDNGGPIEALIVLLRHGANVEGWGRTGDDSPLLMALFRSQREAVRLLLAAGADVNVVGSEGDTPLRWSVEQGDRATASLLLCCGAAKTIDQGGGASGMNTLGTAAAMLNPAMVVLLLSAGASPQALDADGRSARQRMPERDQDNQIAWDETDKLLS